MCVVDLVSSSYPGTKTRLGGVHALYVLASTRLILCKRVSRTVPALYILARLRNHNATDDDNVDFRSYFKKSTFKAWKVNVR